MRETKGLAWPLTGTQRRETVLHFLSRDTKIPAQSISRGFKNFLSRRGSQLNITMDYYMFFVGFPPGYVHQIIR